jgi:hypothetical protein
VDELKRKAENTEKEFEEFKIQQQEEYNKLREDIMCFSSSSGNSQSFDVVKLWFFHIVYRLMW